MDDRFVNIANSRNGRSLDERDRRGRSVVWAEPTLECPSESSIERPKMAGYCPMQSANAA